MTHGKTENEDLYSNETTLDQSDIPLHASNGYGKETEFQHSGEDEEQQSSLQRFKNDKVYRNKVIISLCICWSFVYLGWVVGQFGPSFLDLQLITNVTIEKGSFYVIVGSVGYLIGSVTSGILYDKVSKLGLLFVEMFISVFVLVSIPFCTIFELMLVLQAFRGFFGGGLDTTGNAIMLATWSGEGRSFMQALHFAFAIGGILSPLATAPFLLEKLPDDPPLLEEKNTSINVNTTTVALPTQFTLPDNSSMTMPSQESQLYKAYFITGAITLSAAIPILMFLIYSYKTNYQIQTQDEKLARKVRDLPRNSKILCLVFLVCFFICYCAVEDTFNSFLTAFCVKQFKWTKVSGSVLTSAFWASYGLFRFLGIFLVKLFKPKTLLFVFGAGLPTTFIGVLVSSIFISDVGMWICGILAGVSMSILFPTMFTWAEECLLPVSGKISSLFLIASSAGSMTNPVILGYLMDEHSPLWFCYLLLGESIICFVVLLTLFVIEKKLIGKLGSPFRDVEIEIKDPSTDQVDQQSLLNVEIADEPNVPYADFSEDENKV